MNRLLLPIFLFFISCIHEDNSSNISVQTTDTTKAFKVDAFWITPKPSLDFNALNKSFNDTLDLVICSAFSFSPFGKLSDTSGLKSKGLRNFNKTDTLIDFGTQTKFLAHKLKFKNSNLLIWFDTDLESSNHSYILSGDINDAEITLINETKIGMSKDTFISTYFEHFPKKLRDRYQVFVFETCVTDISHIYTFKNNNLINISFVPTPLP